MEQLPSKKVDCSAEKCLPMRHNKLLVLNATEECYFTLGTPRNWKELLEQEKRTMFLKEHITGLTWPRMYKNLRLNASLSDGVGRHNNTDNGYNCFQAVDL